MRNSLLIQFFLLLFVSCGNIKEEGKKQIDENASFVDWNKKTFSSLKKHLHESNDTAIQALYKNRIAALQEYLEISNDDTLNKNSIRYQFLETLYKENIVSNKEYYIVECRSSGEVVEILNYVIYPANKVSTVKAYNYQNQKWVQRNPEIKIDIDLNRILDAEARASGIGINDDDIIVSKFVDNEVVESEYFLYNTLSENSEIRKVITIE